MVYQDVIRPSKDVRTYRVNFLLWKEQWDAYTAPPPYSQEGYSAEIGAAVKLSRV